MSSGDVGYLDEAGRLFVVGRDDEMIVSGGENVYPIEVEKTLAAHSDVAEAAVIGVDDEQYGQRLAAFVVLEPGALVRLPRPSSNTSARTWPTTRCPARYRCSTSFPAAAPARSCAPNCNRGSAADGRRLRKPRPLARAAVEFINAANGLRPLARKGYSTVTGVLVRLADVGGAGPVLLRLAGSTRCAAAAAATSPGGGERRRWP